MNDELIGYWCWDADRGSPRQAEHTRPESGYGMNAEQDAAKQFARGLWKTRAEREVTFRVGVMFNNGFDVQTWHFIVHVSSEPKSRIEPGSVARTANVEHLIVSTPAAKDGS